MGGVTRPWVTQRLVNGRQSAPTNTPTSAPEATKPPSASLRPWLITGVSYTIPFVVTGGILIARPTSSAGPTWRPGSTAAPSPAPPTAASAHSSPWRRSGTPCCYQIGAAALSLLVPVLAGFIADAMAGPMALVAGVGGGLLADLVGAGYLCGLLAGLVAGGLVLLLNRLPSHSAVAGLVPVVGIPVLSTSAVGLTVLVLLGPPLAAAQRQLTTTLDHLSGTNTVLIGLALGLMIALDIGGPVNKTAYALGLPPVRLTPCL